MDKTLFFSIAVLGAIALSLYRRCTLNPMTSGELVYRDDEPGTYWFGIVLYVLIAAALLYVHFQPRCFT